MRYEHLVQINDPLLPLLDPLSRAQLWNGLVRRAEEPTLFVLGLQGCTVHERQAAATGTRMTRTLDFGSFAVHDHVDLRPQTSVCTRTRPGPTWPAARLTITIEEPQPELLYLRFLYEFDEPPAPPAEAAERRQTDALRRQAYFTADLDTVAQIRALALAGELE